MRAWVFLLYHLPAEPSARRVHVWRKLKRLGAALLENAVWAAPATPALVEQFQWLAQEIVAARGSASVWQAQASLPRQDEELVARFIAQADAAYLDLLRELEEGGADLPALTRRYRQIQALDYFHAGLGESARQALLEARHREDEAQ